MVSKTKKARVDWVPSRALSLCEQLRDGRKSIQYLVLILLIGTYDRHLLILTLHTAPMYPGDRVNQAIRWLPKKFKSPKSSKFQKVQNSKKSSKFQKVQKSKNFKIPESSKLKKSPKTSNVQKVQNSKKSSKVQKVQKSKKFKIPKQGFENNGNDAGVAVALPLPLPKKRQRQLDLSLP